METLHGMMNGCLITPWEGVFFALVVSLLALMRCGESCLINTFSFTYYWGFKSLLQNLSASSAASENAIILYTLSGLAIFALIHLSYIKRDLILGRHGRGWNQSLQNSMS